MSVEVLKKLTVAIIGSGNIGTDLMLKIVGRSKHLTMGAVIGIDANSEGLALARKNGVQTCSEGLSGFMKTNLFKEVDLFFDATSASAHVKHAEMLSPFKKAMVDMTPAAIGPFVVPPVNLDTNKTSLNVNMVTCGGQATVPMVAAVSAVSEVVYAEIVSSISSRSAGPGTRANIDEFTETTSKAIETVGGAKRGKAIIILNPAEPPLIMRNTVFMLSNSSDEVKITNAIEEMVNAVQQYVPGYRLKQKVQFEHFDQKSPVTIPGYGVFIGTRVSVFLEVEGAADYLPSYAGNLDIMTSAAMKTAEQLAIHWEASKSEVI